MKSRGEANFAIDKVNFGLSICYNDTVSKL